MATTETPAEGMLVAEAAAHLGISADAVRKRVYRGALESYRVDGRLYVVVPANGRHATPRDDGRDATTRDDEDGRLAALRAELAVVRDERDHLRQHVHELTVLMGRIAEQRALPPPTPRPWWRFWRRREP